VHQPDQHAALGEQHRHRPGDDGVAEHQHPRVRAHDGPGEERGQGEDQDQGPHAPRRGARERIGHRVGRGEREQTISVTDRLSNQHLRGANISPQKRKLLRDKLAAQILLQTFLESSRRGEAPQAMT